VNIHPIGGLIVVMGAPLFDLNRYFFSIYAVPTFVAAAAIFLLGGAVLFYERGRKVGRLFFYMTLAVSLWLFSFSWMYCAVEEGMARVWAKLGYLAVTGIPSTVYNFSAAVLRIERQRRIWRGASWFLSAFFALSLLFSDAFLVGLYRYRWGYYPKAGWMGIPFLLFFFGMMLRSLSEYDAQFRNGEPGVQRERAKSFLIAFGIAYLGSLDFLANYGVSLYPFGYLPILAYFFIAARTIRQYRLIDITPAFAADQIFSTIADLLIACDAEGKIQLVNRATCTALGYSEGDLLGKPVGFLAASPSQLEERVQEAIKGAPIQGEEIRFCGQGGRTVEACVSISQLRDREPLPLGAVVIGRDMTDRKRVEAALQRSKQDYEALVQSIEGIVWEADARTFQFVFVSRQAEHLLGYPVERWLTDPTFWRDHLHPEDREWATAYCTKATEEIRDHDFEYRMVAADGRTVWFRDLVHVVVDEKGSPAKLRGIMVDITKQKVGEERLNYLGHHDPLTDLPNRNLLSDRLNQALSRVRWRLRPVAVLFIDLDRFKIVNDTLGHTIGDLLLKAVAERLRSALRDGDTIARLGGDEFVLILSDLAQPEDAAKVAEKIVHAFSRSFDLGGHEFFITASIGIALYPGDGEDTETLLRNADAAMYRAKEQGRNNFQLYSPAMNVKAAKRLAMEAQLRRAVERGELLLHYQPKVDLTGGRIAGMEALLRWRSPSLGMVSPAEFIPLAEETGLIVPIGEWVIRTVTTQIKAWQAARLPVVPVAVNLSPRQFQPNLVQTVSRILKEENLNLSFLGLEVTENMVMKQAAATVEMLDQLNALGIELSIDDFGTGYSSLGYLKRFHVHALKIDGSFIRDIPDDADDAAIVSAMMTLAHSLKLKVVAEAVETKAQLAFLRSLGCDQIQGDLFSKPLPAAEMEQLLREGRSLSLEEG
jgi:diguanylate cyclase (GGDEF)-like protein/PAS domain S-box-containing protein